MLAVGLSAVANHLRSREFHEHVIIDAIVLAALASVAREGWASTLVRLAAWDKRLSLRPQRGGRVYHRG